MFWKHATRSHITRLTLLTSVTVGVMLALVFVGIYGLTRSHTLSEVRESLNNAAMFLTSNADELSNPREFHAEHPNKSIRLFRSERETLRVGTLELAPTPGFREADAYISVGVPYDGGLLVVGTPSEDAERGLERLAWVLSIMWFPLVALVAFTTHRAARSTFAPLNRLAVQAAEISGSDLSQRLDSQDRAEFGQLAIQLNAMLGRLEQGARREEQFASDAAHELRTPLAILRTRIETTLLNDRKPADYRRAMEALLVEVERLSVTAESLLSTTRARSTSPDPVDISGIVLDCVEQWRAQFESAGQQLEAKTNSAIVRILPEEVLIILGNLLDNARRYSGPEGKTWVDLSVDQAHEATVTLRVTDDGPGVAPDLEERVFDRFVRGEESRNKATGGIGIGLALARRLVETRNGRISYERSEGGSSFVCRWPQA